MTSCSHIRERTGRTRDDAYVWWSFPGGGSGGEVCCLRLHHVQTIYLSKLDRIYHRYPTRGSWCLYHGSEITRTSPQHWMMYIEARRSVFRFCLKAFGVRQGWGKQFHVVWTTENKTLPNFYYKMMNAFWAAEATVWASTSGQLQGQVIAKYVWFLAL